MLEAAPLGFAVDRLCDDSHTVERRNTAHAVRFVEHVISLFAEGASPQIVNREKPWFFAGGLGETDGCIPPVLVDPIGGHRVRVIANRVLIVGTRERDGPPKGRLAVPYRFVALYPISDRSECRWEW